MATKGEKTRSGVGPERTHTHTNTCKNVLNALYRRPVVCKDVCVCVRAVYDCISAPVPLHVLFVCMYVCALYIANAQQCNEAVEGCSDMCV